MGVVIIDTLQRGGSGTSPFAVIQEADSKISYVTVADLTARNSIEEWRRLSNMQCYVISEAKAYRLGTDLTIAGQVWTEIPGGSSGVFQELAEKGQADGYVPLNANIKIDPSYIDNIYSNTSYVAASEAAMLALATQTGDIVTRTDTSEIYVKLNNNAPPTVIGDFAELLFPGAVLSVNGQTGAVSITIGDLIVADQVTFDTAVGNAPAVTSNASAITTNQSDILDLQNAVAGLQGLDNQISDFDSGVDYVADVSYVVWAADTQIELYKCIQSTTNPSPDPSDGAFWGKVGDYYTQTEIANLLADKADLIGGVVPLAQLPPEALAAAAVHIYAETRYVDTADGSDTNDGQYNTPYKTLDKALTERMLPANTGGPFKIYILNYAGDFGTLTFDGTGLTWTSATWIIGQGSINVTAATWVSTLNITNCGYYFYMVNLPPLDINMFQTASNYCNLSIQGGTPSGSITRTGSQTYTTISLYNVRYTLYSEFTSIMNVFKGGELRLSGASAGYFTRVNLYDGGIVNVLSGSGLIVDWASFYGGILKVGDGATATIGRNDLSIFASQVIRHPNGVVDLRNTPSDPTLGVDSKYAGFDNTGSGFTSDNAEDAIKEGGIVADGMGTTKNGEAVDLGGGEDITGQRFVTITPGGVANQLRIQSDPAEDVDKWFQMQQDLFSIYGRTLTGFGAFGVETQGFNYPSGLKVGFFVKDVSGTNEFGAGMYASEDGYITIFPGAQRSKMLGFRFAADYSDIDWAGNELLIPHLKQVRAEIAAAGSYTAIGTWYVNENGNDTTGDGTAGNPYATIGKVLTEVNSGDVVYLLGAFGETLSIDTPFLTFIGMDGQTTINGNITFTGATVDLVFRNISFAGTGNSITDTATVSSKVTFDNCTANILATTVKGALNFNSCESWESDSVTAGEIGSYMYITGSRIISGNFTLFAGVAGYTVQLVGSSVDGNVTANTYNLFLHSSSIDNNLYSCNEIRLNNSNVAGTATANYARYYEGYIGGTATIGNVLSDYNHIPNVAPPVREVWVDKTGNDTTGTGISSAPYLTIQKAVTEATAGDIIYINPGFYNETVTVAKSLYFKGTAEMGISGGAIPGEDTPAVNIATVNTEAGATTLSFANIRLSAHTVSNDTDGTTVVNYNNCYINNPTYDNVGNIGSAMQIYITHSFVAGTWTSTIDATALFNLAIDHSRTGILNLDAGDISFGTSYIEALNYTGSGGGGIQGCTIGTLGPITNGGAFLFVGDTIAHVDNHTKNPLGIGSIFGSNPKVITLPTKADKNATASVTTADGQTTGVSISNLPWGYIQVMVNGRQQAVGDGVKTTACYFSGDGGTTARGIEDVLSGDILYWNGSIAGFQLATTDIIDLNYNA